MFGVDFSELLVIGIVALVVIGPERLPGVARTLGHLLGRAQRYVNEVRADIHREIELEELRKWQSEIDDAARSLESDLQRSLAGEAIRNPLPSQPAPVTGESSDDSVNGPSSKQP